MAHYAIIDENNIVTSVFVGKDENELDQDGNVVDWENYYGAIRTSYNTVGGVHINGGTPFRKNYAGVGMIYDSVKDAFYGVQPFPSWTLNEDSCFWEPPIPKPENDLENGIIYRWNENNLSWDLVNEPILQ